MQIDGVSAIAIILIASFAIDRIVNGLLFLLSLFKPWRKWFPDPNTIMEPGERANAKRKQTVLYFILAGILGIVVLAWYGEIRIFKAVLGRDINPILDTIVTGLTLVAGADRIAEIMKLPGAPGKEKPSSRPVEITGKLVLENPPQNFKSHSE